PTGWQGFWVPGDNDGRYYWGSQLGSDSYAGALLVQTVTGAGGAVTALYGLRFIVSAGQVTSVVWYQALPDHNPARLLTPTGPFTGYAARQSMLALANQNGLDLYSIAQPINALPPPH